MSGFVGEMPGYRPYPDGVTWYLMAPLTYDDQILGRVIVPGGFETDFASVPQAFTNLFPRWADYGPASVVHDWLYWNQQTDREQADDVFLDAMLSLEVPLWKRRSLFYAVRMFGQAAWDDNAKIGGEGYSRIHIAGSSAPAWHREA